MDFSTGVIIKNGIPKFNGRKEIMGRSLRTNIKGQGLTV